MNLNDKINLINDQVNSSFNSLITILKGYTTDSINKVVYDETVKHINRTDLKKLKF